MYFKKLELNWHIKFANYPNGTEKKKYLNLKLKVYISENYITRLCFSK